MNKNTASRCDILTQDIILDFSARKMRFQKSWIAGSCHTVISGKNDVTFRLLPMTHELSAQIMTGFIAEGTLQLVPLLGHNVRIEEKVNTSHGADSLHTMCNAYFAAVTK